MSTSSRIKNLFYSHRKDKKTQLTYPFAPLDCRFTCDEGRLLSRCLYLFTLAIIELGEDLHWVQSYE